MSTRWRPQSLSYWPTSAIGESCEPEPAASWKPSATGHRALGAIASLTIGSPARRMPPMAELEPRIVVLTTLFPHAGQPTAGLFIRERMFRVARLLPLTAVAPVSWFSLQVLLRKRYSHFRPLAPSLEMQEGISVRRRRCLTVL